MPPLVALVVGVLTVAALAGASAVAAAGRVCATDEGGYAYAGYQAAQHGHGVRATIIATREPSVDAGHVAGRVGVGGPGQGASERDAWMQAGIPVMPGIAPLLYAEITRGGSAPRFVLLRPEVSVRRSHRIAVLETSGRPGWWRVWVDGRAATAPVHIRGSSGRWAPIATAESLNGGGTGCNAFGFRFERISVSYGGGDSWRPFVAGHRFLDRDFTPRRLAAAPAEPGAYRTLAGASVRPYAFVAASR